MSKVHARLVEIQRIVSTASFDIATHRANQQQLTKLESSYV